jgi:hypothetical protein
VYVKRAGASLLVRAGQQGRVLRITTQLVLARKIYPTKLYAGLKKVVDGVRGLQHRSLYLTRSRP